MNSRDMSDADSFSDEDLDGRLGDAIRRCLFDSYGCEVPSSEAWARIRGRIEDQLARTNKRGRNWSLRVRTAPLAQALVLIALLVVFRVGLDSSLGLPQEIVVPTIVTESSAVSSPVYVGAEDALSGLRLMRSSRELTIMDYRLAPFVEIGP